ncbi:roadblock/LC7 domain-containing protein [Dactylosporangium sp. NPDC051485]|uniref:roadblock/LC7 domain-containing protein n=1 Tax=Dactylosporangium sp. NPDC051485 TaxID=3154846 RepID=UPI00343BAFAB
MKVMTGSDGVDLRAGVDEDQVSMLLCELPRQVHGIEHAIALSADGIRMAWTDGLDETRAERLSAIVSSLNSLSRSTGTALGTGDTTYTMIMMSGGALLVMPVGNRLCLAALAHPDADIGAVAAGLAATVDRVGELITPSRRPATVAGR